jgi:hypothetical protein
MLAPPRARVPTLPARVCPGQPPWLHLTCRLQPSRALSPALSCPSPSGLPIEYRDESWDIGGGEGKTTMPGFLGVFSPSLTGMSTKDHLPETHGMPHQPDTDHLNAAQSEARVDDVQGQIEYLLQQLNSTKGIDPVNDWKVRRQPGHNPPGLPSPSRARVITCAHAPPPRAGCTARTADAMIGRVAPGADHLDWCQRLVRVVLGPPL